MELSNKWGCPISRGMTLKHVMKKELVKISNNLISSFTFSVGTILEHEAQKQGLRASDALFRKVEMSSKGDDFERFVDGTWICILATTPSVESGASGKRDKQNDGSSKAWAPIKSLFKRKNEVVPNRFNDFHDCFICIKVVM